MLHVCTTVAKPCCRTGSFLEGFFGMTGIYAGLSAVTLTHLHLFVCTREYVLACAHYNKCKKKAKTTAAGVGGVRGVGGCDQQLLTKTLYTTLNLIFCKIKHNND